MGENTTLSEQFQTQTYYTVRTVPQPNIKSPKLLCLEIHSN